jgi:hypothetical protein
MPDYSVEQELVQFGEGALTFLEARMGSNHQAADILAFFTSVMGLRYFSATGLPPVIETPKPR